MNYGDMSDLEINKLVAEKLGLLIADEDSRAYGYGYREKYPSTIWVAKHEFGNQIEPWEQMNFVKTPNEYMQIVIEHEISINFDDGNVEAGVDVDTNNPVSGKSFQITLSVDLEKSQIGRAICIVYLKMMEAKREK